MKQCSLGLAETSDDPTMVAPVNVQSLSAALEAQLPAQRVQRDLPLAPLCTYRVGGPARLAVIPRTSEELAAAVRLFRRREVPFSVLGRGSNVLIADRGLETPLIVTTALDKIQLDGDRILAQGGVPCTRLAAAALQAGLSGLEFFHCLPGSAGGAAFMNGRAFGQEVGQILAWAESVTAEGEIRRCDIDPAAFSYKRSPFMEQNLIVTKVAFRLQPAARSEIRARMEQNEKHRRCKGEMDYPSCGCVFKNTRDLGRSAGAIIDECGLKGFRQGGVWVSHKHANFVVHSGKATAAQIRRLMDQVRNVVQRKTGHLLSYEVRFLGDP
jgi:UDP-N-acetylmuramate dehydrogenase